MIVCLCHRVSDRDIRGAVQCGVRCFEQLQDDTRVASSCGCCMEYAQQVFDEALGQAGERPGRAGMIPVRLAVASA